MKLHEEKRNSTFSCSRDLVRCVFFNFFSFCCFCCCAGMCWVLVCALTVHIVRCFMMCRWFCCIAGSYIIDKNGYFAECENPLTANILRICNTHAHTHTIHDATAVLLNGGEVSYARTHPPHAS